MKAKIAATIIPKGIKTPKLNASPPKTIKSTKTVSIAARKSSPKVCVRPCEATLRGDIPWCGPPDMADDRWTCWIAQFATEGRRFGGRCCVA